uniref:Uncharacterized protein n=1 Tax=Oryza rufipogon TaxID=4529 RepID=A0A0E0P619_ORYRU
MVVRTAEEERVDSVKNPAHECTTVRGRESARRKCVGDAGERGGKSETQDGGCGVISPFQVREGEEGERWAPDLSRTATADYAYTPPFASLSPPMGTTISEDAAASTSPLVLAAGHLFHL